MSEPHFKITLREEAKQDLSGRKIMYCTDEALHLDTGLAIYLSENEIEHINNQFEGDEA